MLRDTYHTSDDGTLSSHVIELITEHKGDDFSITDFQLYDSIDPNALDNIFKEEPSPETKLMFTCEDVAVELYGDGAISIIVSDKEKTRLLKE